MQTVSIMYTALRSLVQFKSVQGSLISLPFFNGTDWTYDYETVNLASKINVSGITVTKTVEDSKVGTQKNAEYTLTASTAGSTTNKVGTYAIVDNMDKRSFTH